MSNTFGIFSEDVYKAKQKSMQQKVWDVFTKTLPGMGYEDRVGQQDMAYDIAESIADHRHLIIEAGVGIGKSFGYLFPLLCHHKQFHKPLIVSTSTIALQEQLKSDIESVSKILNYPIQVLLIKGQSHYVCRERADMNAGAVAPQDAWLYGEISKGSHERSMFSNLVSDRLWDQVNVQQYRPKNCMRCAYRDKKCIYHMLRSEVKRTDQLILCNHDLLTAHLHRVRNGDEGIFSDNVALQVIDEAHNLEEKIRSSLTIEVTIYSIQTIINAAMKITANREMIDNTVNRFFDECDKLFHIASQDIAVQDADRTCMAQDSGRYHFRLNSHVLALIKTLSELLLKIDEHVQMWTLGSNYTMQDYVLNELSNLSDSINGIKDDSRIIWLEKVETARKQGHHVKIVTCPKNIDEVAGDLYFGGNPTTILTSATLTNGSTSDIEDAYKYIAKSIGFPNSPDGEKVEPKLSPFPYDQNALIYYADALPHPTNQRDSFLAEASLLIEKLLKITDGKALILFTAKSDLNVVYDNLLRAGLPYSLLRQERNSSQAAVLAKFRGDTNSVLLGTGSYWEGINVEGSALSQLIVFRLPFPVPDPIVEYKTLQAEKNGLDSMMDVLVPEMIIKLKQGVGRLIRNYTDRGIVSIIDPRLASNAPYSQMVWDALPIKTKTRSYEDATRFMTTRQ